jgi:hypothetical protein
MILLGSLGSAGIAVLVGVLVSVLSSQAQRVVPSPSGSTAPQLAVDGISLTSANFQLNGNNLIFQPYKIDIKLLNTGSGMAVINDARLVIQQFAALPLCQSQGYLESDHTYNGKLPVDPKPGQVVDIPLSEEVQSNDAGRFDLDLGTSLPHGKLNGQVYLYRVKLYLTYNIGTEPLDVGEFLIDAPNPPVAGEYYWDSYYSTHPQVISGVVYAPDIPAYKRCAISNSHALYSVLSLPSNRPATLAEILPTLRFK